MSITHQADSIILGCTTFNFKRLLSVVYSFKKAEPLGECVKLHLHMCAFSGTCMGKVSCITSEKQYFVSITKKSHKGD